MEQIGQVVQIPAAVFGVAFRNVHIIKGKACSVIQLSVNPFSGIIHQLHQAASAGGIIGRLRAEGAFVEHNGRHKGRVQIVGIGLLAQNILVFQGMVFHNLRFLRGAFLINLLGLLFVVHTAEPQKHSHGDRSKGGDAQPQNFRKPCGQLAGDHFLVCFHLPAFLLLRFGLMHIGAGHGRGCFRRGLTGRRIGHARGLLRRHFRLIGQRLGILRTVAAANRHGGLLALELTLRLQQMLGIARLFVRRNGMLHRAAHALFGARRSLHPRLLRAGVGNGFVLLRHLQPVGNFRAGGRVKPRLHGLLRLRRKRRLRRLRRISRHAAAAYGRRAGRILLRIGIFRNAVFIHLRRKVIVRRMPDTKEMNHACSFRAIQF